MNKRGQFFIIAAVIIIGVIISLAAVINSIRTNSQQESFYRRAGEIGYESKRVLDYGTYLPSPDLNADLQSFLDEYADYISQEQVLFIFGDEAGNVDALFYDTASIGSIGIATGGPAATVQVQQLTGTDAQVEVIGNTVNAEIEGTNYAFNLKQGHNFFFVIIKTEDEERYVAQG